MATEKRLIESNRAMKFLKEAKVNETGAFSRGINKGLNVALSALGNREITPTVDAVEVVRCKDCRKEGTEECPQVHRDALFKNLYAGTKPDGFCSCGERKDDELQILR